jgi:RNA polymerase sigma-70 factor (ECF subfamily)
LGENLQRADGTKENKERQEKDRRDEKALIARSSGGDMAAFEELVFRYERRVVPAACRLCGDRQEGEDLAQETFLKAWRALPGYRGQASLGTWLMAILTNLWRDKLRKAQLPQESLDAGLETGGGYLEKQRGDSRPGPERVYEEKETALLLGQMLQELKPEHKEVLILRDVQGFSYEEVAVITGHNLGTVKSRINRARVILKERILRFQEQNPGFFRLNQTKAPFQADSERTDKGESV